jgi:hypothetical protein
VVWGIADRRYQLYGVFRSLLQEDAKNVPYENTKMKHKSKNVQGSGVTLWSG